MSSLELDLESKHEKNMKVLKSIEGGVSQIIEDVPYIAVYTFDIDNTAWKRMGVEGPAFITRNSRKHMVSGNSSGGKNVSGSKYSFSVLNKKGSLRFAAQNILYYLSL